MLEDMAQKDAAKNATFWKDSAAELKEAWPMDPANGERIAKLLRFSSTHDDGEEQKVSLADYVSRMKEGQDRIFLRDRGNTFRAARNSPHLEIFRKRGIEVLLQHERIDEWHGGPHDLLRGQAASFRWRAASWTSAGSGARSRRSPARPPPAEHEALVERMKVVLGDRVKDVRITSRLTQIRPRAWWRTSTSMGSNLARDLKAAGQKVPAFKPILELNPEHTPIVRRLRPDDARFADWAACSSTRPCLAEGGHPRGPAEFVRRSNELMLSARGRPFTRRGGSVLTSQQNAHAMGAIAHLFDNNPRLVRQAAPRRPGVLLPPVAAAKAESTSGSAVPTPRAGPRDRRAAARGALRASQHRQRRRAQRPQLPVGDAVRRGRAEGSSTSSSAALRLQRRVRPRSMTQRLGLADNWLRHLQDVHAKHDARVAQAEDTARRIDRLCELNVIEQVANVCQTTIVRDAWDRGQGLTVHGWVYGLRDGLLRDLGTSVERPDGAARAYRAALAAIGPGP